MFTLLFGFIKNKDKLDKPVTGFCDLLLFLFRLAKPTWITHGNSPGKAVS
jgi:hypothetical protein